MGGSSFNNAGTWEPNAAAEPVVQKGGARRRKTGRKMRKSRRSKNMKGTRRRR
jgi:hypothetical protein